MLESAINPRTPRRIPDEGIGRDLIAFSAEGETGRGQARRLRRGGAAAYCAARADFEVPLALRLPRPGAAAGALRPGDCASDAAGGGPGSPPCSITRSRATFLRCWS